MAKVKKSTKVKRKPRNLNGWRPYVTFHNQHTGALVKFVYDGKVKTRPESAQILNDLFPNEFQQPKMQIHLERVRIIEG